MKKKCFICGQPIEIELPYDKTYVWHSNKWNHDRCLRHLYGSNNRLHWDNIYAKTELEVRDAVSRANMERLIYERYHTNYISSAVLARLKSVYSGQRRGLKDPVKPEVLYSAFCNYEQELNRIPAARKLEGTDKFFYELSVVLSRIGNEKRSSEAMQSEALRQHRYTAQELSDLQCKPKYSSIGDDIESLLNEV